MKLGIGSFAYRWSVGRPYYRPENPMSIYELIERCKMHGVSSVLFCNNMELENYDDDELRKVKAKLDEYGIECETGSRGTDPEYFRRMLNVSKILGSKVLRIGWDMDRDTDQEGIERQVQNGIDTIKGLMPVAHEYGIEIGIENGKLNHPNEVKQIILGVGDPAFGCILDTCNSTCFVYRAEEVVELLAPYAKHVHFKDYKVKLDPDGDIIWGTPLGQGFNDFPKYKKVLEDAGFDGTIFIELYIAKKETHEETIRYEEECVAQSVKYAKEVLGLK